MTFTNESGLDRIVRLFVAMGFAIAAWAMWPGAWAMAFVIVAAIAMVTALAGWCPSYTLFGISTKRTDTKTAA